MAFNVMHRHKRLFRRPGNGFRCCDADQKRANQTRTVCHGNRRDLIQRHVSLFQRLFHNLIYLFNMFSRSNLRHNASELRVQGDLRGDNIRKNFSSVLYDSRCGLVAGALDRKNVYILINTVFSHDLPYPLLQSRWSLSIRRAQSLHSGKSP